MSAEVAVKKRGRPKKVVLDPVEMEVPETKKSTSRAKSTKATTTSTRAKPAALARTPVAANPISNPIEATSTASKASAKPHTASVTSAAQKVETVNFRPPLQSPVTPETSKILSKVRDLSAISTQRSTQSSNPTKPPAASIPKPPPSTATSPPKPSTPPQTKSPTAPPPLPTSTPRTPPQPRSIPLSSNVPPKATPKIPIAALNSAVVSKLSERAGARPNRPGSQQLPPNYKKTLRKVTATIVALPIAIVTSYVLYQRLALGQEQKFLPRSAPAAVESTQPAATAELSTEEK